MKTMMMQYRMLTMGAMALALFVVVSASAFAAEEAKEATQDGRVVSITGDTLVMTHKGDKDNQEYSHRLAADAKVTLDGKACKAEDLKVGTKIRVTMQTSYPMAATHIEAIDKNETFANTHDGKLVSITSSRLVMTDKDGKEHSHSVLTDTKVTLDGKACKTEDLKAGMKIRVTTKKTDEKVAVEIEAIDKNAEFAQ